MSARKRGLGRGLDALLKVEPVALDEAPRELSVARLRPNRYQPRARFDEESLEELAASIRAQGLVQPVVVSPLPDGDYMIIAGERRWRAAQRAGLKAVPVVVRAIEDERQVLELALVENLQRSDLNPIEEARAYRELQQGFGLTQEAVAQRVGKSRAAVTNSLRLLRLPEEVQDLLESGRLTAGQARPLLALDSTDDQLRLARQAADGRLSARKLEALAQGGGARPRKAARKVDPDTRAAEAKLTRRLQTKVEIRRRGARGSVQIAFHSEEELMRIFELLMEAGRK